MRWSSQLILAVMRVRWNRSCRDLAASPRRSGWGISAARCQWLQKICRSSGDLQDLGEYQYLGAICCS